jgi:hypothetical protein
LTVAPFDATDALRRIVVLRIKLEGLAEIRESAGEIALPFKGDAATEEEAPVRRVEPDCSDVPLSSSEQSLAFLHAIAVEAR